MKGRLPAPDCDPDCDPDRVGTPGLRPAGGTGLQRAVGVQTPGRGGLSGPFGSVWVPGCRLTLRIGGAGCVQSVEHLKAH